MKSLYNGFYVKESGFLECDDCGSIWCVHLEKLIRENKDALSLWENSTEEDEGQVVKVPIVPSLQIWTDIELINYRPDMRKIQPHESSQFIWLEIRDDWGFLQVGEGRKVLRDIILTKFVAAFPNTPKCKSSSHGPAQEKYFQENGKQFFFKWISASTGMCPPCRSRSVNVGEDPDLIPESDSPFRR